MGLGHLRDFYIREKEFPFNFNNKWMAVSCRRKITHEPPPEQEIIFMKGALERVIKKCRWFSNGDRILPLSSAQEKMYVEEARQMGFGGLRGE